jgi:exodeoxyribonuclease V alpha subunit
MIFDPGATRPGDADPAGPPQTETIEGVVDRIVFESPESGFIVARLRVRGKVDLQTFVGNSLPITPGETVRLRGQWIEDKRFGPQLRVASYETILPTSVEGIERYLGSGLIEGIGPTYARRLVDAFGAETLRVIDEQPDRLRGVPGIGPKRAVQIRDAWQRQKSIQSVMMFLQSHGVTPGLAGKIYRRYGDNAVAVLRSNPYRLADDITGLSFRGADALARQLGIAEDAPERVQAGLLHTLRQGSYEGHVYLPQDELREAAKALLGVSREAIDAGLAALVLSSSAVREGDAWYLAALYQAESAAARLLKTLIATPREPVRIQLEKALAWAEGHFKIQLAPEQRAAIEHGVHDKVLVITGGPGTGKTTVINSLLAILEKKAQSFLLAAPTGRAAKRMEAATGREARTLHRLLEFSPISGSFTRNETNPLDTDLIVVDEASMIDATLLHALLRAIPAFTRLVLVGDVDQLPSVGAGNVLLDIIVSGMVPVVRLQTVFRQDEESGIVANAHRINAGEYPKFNTTDFFLIERHEPARALETIVELVSQRMPAKFGLDPFLDIQVLSPMRRGEAGILQINEALQAALNPDGAPLPRGGLRVGDKVMQLRNDYELEVFNGDVGRITHADADTQELQVTFDDGRIVLYPYDELESLALAYACTIHKSQGSEYPAVVIPFLPQHYMMLQRNVLYTAITRGKRLVIVVGEPKAVAMAIRNNRIARRHTRLSDRLRNAPVGNEDPRQSLIE